MTSPSPVVLIAGRYELRRRLGSPGAQGDVYEAFDHHEGDIVAIKLLHAVPTGATWHEAQILRQLSDNHILPIRNADQDLGRPFLVTALATHGSVDGLIATSGQCGLGIDQTVRLIRHACMGVARAHDARLLHNDIKPANLFLNAEGEVLVGDFGLASLVPPASLTTVAAGFSFETVAPEIAADPGGSHASVRSDVYSLGATAYMMLAATTPHDFANAATIQDRLSIAALAQPPRLWDVAPHVPRSLQTAIERAMDRNPANRFARVVDFANGLGGRAATWRHWRRTDEHPSHIGCWRGEPTRSGSTAILCLEGGLTAARVAVKVRHATSGNEIRRAARHGAAGRWASVVRSAMNAV